MSKERFESVMENLLAVPEVQEYMDSLHVQMALQISERRIQKGLTQKELVEIIKSRGQTITQAQLSRIENGTDNSRIETYEKILEALDLDDIDLNFKSAQPSEVVRKSAGLTRQSTGSIRRSTGSFRQSTGSIRRSTGSFRQSNGPVRKSTGSFRQSNGPVKPRHRRANVMSQKRRSRKNLGNKDRELVR